MIQIIGKGMRAKLTADATISASVGTRVYLEIAAEGAALPYIVMNWIGGGSTNDTPRDMIDVEVQVKVVAGEGTTAITLEKAIRDALHETSLSLDAPWCWMDTQHETSFYFAENADRRQYYHAGGNYRIRATE